MHWLISWLLHWFGLDDPSGAWYLFWSGIFGDVALFGAAGALVHHLNCHTKGCWRPGAHHVEGTPYRVCKTHHPTIDHTQRITAETIESAHADR